MVSPGESIENVVSRFSIDELKKVAGEDVFASLRGLVEEENLRAALENVCSDLLREDCVIYFSDENNRKLIHSKLSKEKFNELLNRVPFEATKKDLALIGIENDKEAFPKYLGFFGLVSSGFKVAPPSLPAERITPEYPLFSHQRNAMERVWSYVKKEQPVVLHMPTGSGKTRTSMHLVARFLNQVEPGLVLWLASTSELLEQAADTFKNAWRALGGRDCNIYRIWGDKNVSWDEVGDGLVVSGFQKLHSVWKKDAIQLLRLAAKVRLVIVDEAHQAIAPTYKDLIEKFLITGERASLVGLTATPGRTWEDISKDEELSAFFDRSKVTLDVRGWDSPVDYLIQERYLAKPIFRELRYDRSASFQGIGDVLSSKSLDQVGADQNRNIELINEVRRLIDKGHSRIIVFCASVNHCKTVSIMLSALGVNADYVHGGTPAEKRRRTIKNFRDSAKEPKVLCNFGVLTTGFDAPNTSAAVIARPTKSLVLFSQMVGRAIRGERAGGNREAEIVTIVDTSLPGFGDVAEAFTNWEDVWRDSSKEV